MAGQMNQHKRMAMGQAVPQGKSTQKFASGGAVKTGLPTSPITDAKRANGVPGVKSGGSVKRGC